MKRKFAFIQEKFSVNNTKLSDEQKLINAISYLKSLSPKNAINSNLGYKALFFFAKSYSLITDHVQLNSIILDHKG